MTRAVIDTNHLLRMAAGGARSALFQHWQAGRFELVLSLATLTELRTVLARPEIQSYIPPAVGEAFCTLLERRAVFVQPDLSAPACRDPGDSVLIATAVGGRPAYLVTADPDLLDDSALHSTLQARGVIVLPAAAFLEHLASTPDG